jgi:hypothetical protein
MTGDEGFYIFAGTVSLRNILRRDFTESSWAAEYHPPFLMALYAFAYGVYVALRLIWHRKLSLENLYNEGATTFSGRRTLFIIRLLPITLASLSSVFVYLLAMELLGDRYIALAAALFFALHPMAIGFTSLTMLEAGLIFFYTGSAWLFFSGTHLPYSIPTIVLAGIFLGLAIASREGGLLLPLTILAISSVETVLSASRSFLNFEYDVLLFLWLALGLLTFYLSWPYLWRHPIAKMRENLRIVSQMKGQKDTGWTYCLREIVMTTPIYLSVLLLIGVVLSLVFSSAHYNYLSVLLLSAVPLFFLSVPSAPKRGVHTTLFTLPFLMMLSAVGLMFIAQMSSQLLSIDIGMTFYALLLVVVMLMVTLDLGLHPYYLQFEDRFGRIGFRWGDRIGQWSEGMDSAMEYIDAHAPSNSEIWIYGMKFSAMYHSNRVNVQETVRGEPLFYTRYVETGYGEVEGREYANWKLGDLQFYFPYYYVSNDRDALLKMLREKNPAYIVVHKWARNDPNLTADCLPPNHHAFVVELSSTIQPEHVVKIAGHDLCWIYSVKDFLERVSRTKD